MASPRCRPPGENLTCVSRGSGWPAPGAAHLEKGQVGHVAFLPAGERDLGGQRPTLVTISTRQIATSATRDSHVGQVANRHVKMVPHVGIFNIFSGGTSGRSPRENGAPRGLFISYTGSRRAHVGQAAWPRSECPSHGAVASTCRCTAICIFINRRLGVSTRSEST